METPLPQDFKEFLALLNSAKIDYLVVGGYAVSYHGYPRPTGDLDVWVSRDAVNARKLVETLARFGFEAAGANEDLFLEPSRVVRMGVPPVRIEIINSISGVEFSDCYLRRIEATLDGLPVKVFGGDELLINKRASGRSKDLNDLHQLMAKFDD